MWHACIANTSYPKAALTRLQAVAYPAGGGEVALPITQFTYRTDRGTAQFANGGWNRLVKVDNGQGGTVELAYEQIAAARGDTLFTNYHRVTSRTMRDSTTSAAYVWTYAYGTPALNSLGARWGSYGPNYWPNLAALYYNRFIEDWRGDANAVWLVHKAASEFRGHDWVTENGPDGSSVEHFFHQGGVECGSPTATNGNIVGDACFQELRNREFLKGREYLTRVRASSGGTLLSETSHVINANFYDYGPAPLSGLWRAFRPENRTEERVFDSNTTVRMKATSYSYEPTYGNQTERWTWDGGTVVRKEQTFYATRNDAASYIVNRPWQTTVRNGSDQYVALTAFFYDYGSTTNTLGTRGLLTRTSAYHNVPTQTSLTNTTLQGADTVLRYDSYGNADQTTTYTGYSTRTNTNGTVTYSAPTGTARTTTTVYDGSFHLFPISSTNAATHGQSAGYDYRLGTLTSVTDANGNVTSAGYDSFGRMISLVKPGDTAAAPTNQFYYADGEIPFRYEVVQREVAGNTTSYRPIEHFYDGLGREIQTKQESKDWSQHIVTDTRYDGFGRVVAQSQPRYIDDATSGFWFYVNPGTGTLFRPTTSTYDALGRVRTSTAPDGSVTTLSYGVDGDGRWSQTIDANSHATRQYSDALGRMTQVREYNGTATPRTLAASTFYRYDTLDRLNRVTDANGNVTTMGYDSLGRKTSMIDPDMGTWSYDYYANGSLKWQLDAKNQKLWFGYDALDRLTTTWRDGSSQPLTTYAYDAAAVPNSKGRRTSAATHTTTGATQTFQTWTYDQRGRVKSMGQSVLGAVLNLEFTYNSADQQTTVTYGNTGEVVSYAYDAALRPYQACTNLGGCFITQATYTPLDQPKEWRMGGTLVQSWEYEPLTQRLSQLTVGSTNAPQSHLNRGYGYDAGGNAGQSHLNLRRWQFLVKKYHFLPCVT